MAVHHHHHGVETVETRNIRIAFLLNLLFTVIEVIGGVMTNSMAILSDAAHDLGDAVSLGLAWYFQRLAGKAGDEAYTYGYQRYSVLGAFITLFILLFGCAFILWESIPRLMAPEEVHAEGMALLAVLGIAVNLVAMLQLRKGKSLNERVVSLHFLEDVLGWIAVLIGSIIMVFFDLPIIDPILSILIACYILFNVYQNMRTTFQVLLQRTPANVNIPLIREKIREKKAIADCADIHIWSLDGNTNIMTAVLYFIPGTDISVIDELTEELHHELKALNVDHPNFESRLFRD